MIDLRRARLFLLFPYALLVLSLLLTTTVTASANRGGKRPPALPRSLDLSVKRLMKEWRVVMAEGLVLLNHGGGNCSLSNNTEHVRLAPCRGNLHEWHFSIAGPPGSVYEGGIYHGRVLLPADYPSSAPRLQMLNPSGRFEVGADICLSATAFHQETWQPVWTVRTLVSALRSHMATKAVEVGGIECSARRRRMLAQRSRGFTCRGCGVDHSGFAGKIFEGLPELLVEEEEGVGVVGGDGNKEGGAITGRTRRRRGRIEGGGGGGNSVVMAGEDGGSLLSVLYRHKLPVALCMLFLLAFVLLNG
jgi:ubiquitin-protein ligase